MFSPFVLKEFKSGRIKPQIIVDRATPFASPAARHFASCMERFGSPIIVFNLVKVGENGLLHIQVYLKILCSVVNIANEK